MHRSPRPLLSPRRFPCLLVGLLIWSGIDGVASTATESSPPTSTVPDAGRAPAPPPRAARTIVLDGWRRTANGWEQFPFAASHPSINDWIAHQRREEAANPLSRHLQQLEPIHPLSLAAAEIAIACLIGAAAAPNRQAGTDPLG